MTAGVACCACGWAVLKRCRMNDVALVHLVHAQNGLDPLRQFLDSYRHHPGGLPHDFVVIFKGFEAPDEMEPHAELLKSFPYRPLRYPNIGFDIDAYLAAAQQLPQAYLCFVNSWSVIQDVEWLRKMYAHAADERAGIVGATASYESLYDTLVRCRSQLGFEPRVRQAILGGKANWRDQLRRYVTLRDLRFRLKFPPFPNPHIRTNAFMVRRDVFLRVRAWPMKVKMDGYRFESGRRSMTRQILRMGLDALVVDSNGKAYSVADWARSETFRQGLQRDLLVADNQTHGWLQASPEEKRLSSRMAWGAQSRV